MDECLARLVQASEEAFNQASEEEEGKETMKKLYVIGIALVATFAFSASMASSASAEGPWWIVLLLSPVEELMKLVNLETEKILGEQGEPFILDGSTANIECPEMHIVEAGSNLIGNNPGMVLAELEFLGCHIQNEPNCLVGSVAGTNTITSNVFGVLVYWDNGGIEERTLAMLALFPDTTASNAFAKFTLQNAPGSTECGLLNGTVVEVTASGTEVTDVGAETTELVDKRCGILAEVGLLNASSEFVESLSGEEVPTGALNTLNTITTAFILHANVGLIECLLEAFLAKAEELGIVEVDLSSGDEFGWEA